MSDKSNEENEDLKEKISQIFLHCNFELPKEDIVCSQLDELFKTSEIKKVLTDDDLIKTTDLFFENNLNISSTSKAGFMHRNTLIYRINKIKHLTGLDIRNFNEASVFKNLVNAYKKLHF